MISEPQMPTYEDLLWPTLKALESIGGSASIQEGVIARFAVKMTRDWDKQSPTTQGCVFTAHGARDDLRQGGSSGCPGYRQHSCRNDV